MNGNRIAAPIPFRNHFSEASVMPQFRSYMPDAQLQVVPEPAQWSFAARFTDSLSRHVPEIAAQKSLYSLANAAGEAAEVMAEHPLDKAFISVAARALAVQHVTTTINSIVSQCALVCESPIELALIFALGVLGREELDSVLFDFGETTLGTAEGATTLRIRPQTRLGDYRVDFLLHAQAVQDSPAGLVITDKKLVLECDGSSYHDETVEQLIRDRKRDRSLQAMGMSVFRFSGSELWRDVFACAREAITFLKSSLEQQIKTAQRRAVATEGNGGSRARAASAS